MSYLPDLSTAQTTIDYLNDVSAAVSHSVMQYLSDMITPRPGFFFEALLVFTHFLIFS
jgi:hypothetical protein